MGTTASSPKQLAETNESKAVAPASCNQPIGRNRRAYRRVAPEPFTSEQRRLRELVVKIFSTPDLIIKIFQFLPWEHQYRLSTITRATLNSYRYYTTSLRNRIPEPHPPAITSKDIAVIWRRLGTSKLSSMLEVDLRSSTVSLSLLCKLLKSCEQLRFLGFLKTEPDLRVYVYMNHCPHLHQIAVRVPDVDDDNDGGKYFGDDDIEALSLTVNDLTQLEIPGTQVTSAGLKRVAFYWPRLKHLDLSRCYSIGDSGLKKIIKRSTNLEYLNVSYTETLGYEVSMLIAEKCDNLQTLIAVGTLLSEISVTTLLLTFDNPERNLTFEYGNVTGRLSSQESLTDSDTPRTESSTTSEVWAMDDMRERLLELNANFHDWELAAQQREAGRAQSDDSLVDQHNLRELQQELRLLTIKLNQYRDAMGMTSTSSNSSNSSSSDEEDEGPNVGNSNEELDEGDRNFFDELVQTHRRRNGQQVGRMHSHV